MRERHLFSLFSLLALIFFDGGGANTTARRDDGQHDVEESNNDSVEFVHETEREQKAQKLNSASSTSGDHLNPSRHLLDQLDELTRLQSMPHFGVATADADRADGTAHLISSFDYLSLLTRKTFQIECCRGGLPQITHPKLVRNFTYNAGEYLTDETESIVDESADNSAEASSSIGSVSAPAGAALNCRMYHGIYLTPPTAFINFDLSYAIQVVCKCPDIGPGHQLDKNCRRLPTCKNNGFRSSIDPQKCLCLQPFFGEKCEKICDRGQRLRGLNGRDYCSCSPFYTGEECREMVCMNGGREENGRCICAPQFLGYHCEIDTNRTRTAGGASHFHTPIDLSSRTGANAGDGTRFQRLGDHVSNEMFTRDISGTIFSLIMIIVLVVSMYLLMKHRMQARYLSRRPDLLNACNFPGAPAFGGAASSGVLSTARRVELMPTFDEATSGTAGGPTSARTFPFRSFVESLANTFIPGDGGPPPYIASGQRGRRNRDEILPPLPSYEDATKLPPLRQHVGVEPAERDASTDERSSEMMARALGASAPTSTVATSRTDENYLSSATPETVATRRQRPYSYAASYENADSDNVASNTNAQEENVSLRSADDDDRKSPTTSAMSICNSSNGSQNLLSSNNSRAHQNTTTKINNAVNNNNRRESARRIIDENNRRSSESAIPQQQQWRRQQQRTRERSLDVENATTTTVDSRHVAT